MGHQAVDSHHAGGGVADGLLILELAQVAEVLEGLGIALTDRFGLRVAVKHTDQLPGRAVAVRGEVDGVPVIVRKPADPVLVSQELFVITLVLVGFDNFQRLFSGLLCCQQLRRVHHVAVHGAAAFGFQTLHRRAAAERLTDGKGQLHLRHNDLRIGTHIFYCADHAGGLVIPVKIIGQVHQQIAVDLVHLQLLLQHLIHIAVLIPGGEAHFLIGPFQRGFLIVPRQGHKAAGLPFRHLSDLLLDGVIQRLAPLIRQPVLPGAEQAEGVFRVHGLFRIGVQDLLAILGQKAFLRDQADFAAVDLLRGLSLGIGRRQNAQQQAKHQQYAQCLFHFTFLLYASIHSGRGRIIIWLT